EILPVTVMPALIDETPSVDSALAAGAAAALWKCCTGAGDLSSSGMPSLPFPNISILLHPVFAPLKTRASCRVVNAVKAAPGPAQNRPPGRPAGPGELVDGAAIPDQSPHGADPRQAAIEIRDIARQQIDRRCRGARTALPADHDVQWRAGV